MPARDERRHLVRQPVEDHLRGQQWRRRAPSGVQDREGDRDLLAGDRESNREIESLVVVLREVNAAFLQIGQSQARDLRGGQDHLCDVQFGRRRIAPAENGAVRAVREPDVLEPVFALALENGQDKGAPGNRAQLQRLWQLRTVQVGNDLQTRDSWVARANGATGFVDRAVAGPHACLLAHADELIGVVRLGVGIDRQSTSADVQTRRRERVAGQRHRCTQERRNACCNSHEVGRPHLPSLRWAPHGR